MLEEKRQRSVNLKFTRLPMPNMYASAVCSGKVTPGGKKPSRKKFQKGSPKIFDQLESKVPYPKGQRVEYAKGGIAKGCGKVMNNRRKVTKKY